MANNTLFICNIISSSVQFIYGNELRQAEISKTTPGASSHRTLFMRAPPGQLKYGRNKLHGQLLTVEEDCSLDASMLPSIRSIPSPIYTPFKLHGYMLLNQPKLTSICSSTTLASFIPLSYAWMARHKHNSFFFLRKDTSTIAGQLPPPTIFVCRSCKLMDSVSWRHKNKREAKHSGSQVIA